MLSTRRVLFTLLGFVGLSALFYSPHLLGLRTFPDGDFTHHFLPFSLFQKEALFATQLPLWNPYTYSGHPFLADIQAAVFYPLGNLLILLEAPFRGLSTVAGRRLYFLELEAALHVALAGLFVYLLAHALTRKQMAAIVAGCTFAFSGYLTGYPPQQLAVLRTAIWLPLILWLLYRAFASPKLSRWWVAASGAISVAFLAGHPQTFLHISYVAAAWIALLFWRSIRNGRNKAPSSIRHLLLGLLMLIFITLGLSAAQLLPTLEFMQQSVRADVSYDFVSGGFPLRDTWQMLLPWVLTHFSPLYVGVIGLGLAVCSFGIFERKESGLSIERAEERENSRDALPFLLFFLISTFVALLLSYGENGFLYRLFYLYAPGWKLFRGQERAAFLVAFGLSILAGYGFSLLPTMPLPRRRLLAALFAALMIGAVYAFGLLWQLADQSAIGNGRYLLVALVTLLLLMTLALSLWLPGWSKRRERLLLALLIGNLFWANMGTNIAPFGPGRKTILAPEMEGLQHAVSASADRNDGMAGRVYNEFRIYEDAGMRLQTEDVWGSSPLRLARYAALFDGFPLERMWQLMGVETVLSWRAQLPAPSQLLAEYPQSNDTTYLHRLEEPNPRAWVVHQTRIVDDEEALALLADPAFDIRTTALLHPRVRADEYTTAPGASSVRMERISSNRLQLSVESETGGLLVISENWMPGWRAIYSEGSGFQPELVNITQIGVPIAPGTTEFDLVYRPASVDLGLMISGATLLLLLLGGIGRWGYQKWR